MTGEPLLAVSDLHAGYGPVRVLRGVHLAVAPGELVCLLGANGAGKSTVLAATVGVVKPAAGRVVFAGEDITGRSPEAIARRRLVLVPEGRQLFGPMTVLENLQLGANAARLDRRERADRLGRVLELFPPLRERLRGEAASLSGGQQQMLAIGRALMADPVLLLLDEPSLGLAPLVVAQLFGILRSLHETGVTILLVEQNARMALEVADRAYVMERGSITLEGRAADLLEDERIRAAYLGLGVAVAGD